MPATSLLDLGQGGRTPLGPEFSDRLLESSSDSRSEGARYSPIRVRCRGAGGAGAGFRVAAIAIGVLAIAQASGCGGARTQSEAPSPFEHPWLDAIAEDSPYFIVQVSEPPPLYFETFTRGLVKPFDRLMSEVMALPATAAGEDTRLAKALARRLHGKLSEAGLKSLGLDARPRVLLYGVGLWPAFRISVTDAARLRQIVEEVLAEAGIVAPEERLGEQAYWRLQFDDAVVVMAIRSDSLVGALFPVDVTDVVVPQVLGITKPQRPLRGSARAKQLYETFGPEAWSVGELALPRMLDALAPGGRAPDEPWLLGGAGEQSCFDEVRGILSTMPRVMLGTVSADSQQLVSRMIVELEPQGHEVLGRVLAPAPGMSIETGHGIPMGFGIGFREAPLMAELRAWGRKRLATPYTCSVLAFMNKLAEVLVEGRFPPPEFRVPSLRGMALVLTRAVLKPLTPQGFEGALVVAGEPAQLLPFMRAFVPTLGLVDLKPGAPPADLPLPMGIQAAFPPVRVAQSANAVGLALGDSGKERLRAMLNHGAPMGGPFVVMHIDGEFQAQVDAYGDQEGLPDAPVLAGASEALEELSAANHAAFSRQSFAGRLEPRGIVVDAVQTLANPPAAP